MSYAALFKISNQNHGLGLRLIEKPEKSLGSLLEIEVEKVQKNYGILYRLFIDNAR